MRIVLILAGLLPAACFGQWLKEPGVRVSQGNVPYIFALDGGRYRLFFCGQGGMLSAISSDGLAFSVEPGVRVPGGCDPSLLRLDDGRYRMYYKTNSGPGGPGQSIHKAHSAISTDGVSFTLEGIRLESEGTIDRGWVSVPEVIRTFDGRWRMYYVSGRDMVANNVASAVSDDGLNFVREEGLRLDGMVDPAVVALPNGQYWLFGMVGVFSPGTQKVIRSATSADGIRFVMDEGDLVRAGGPDDSEGLFDPTVTPIADGRYRMYYRGNAGKTLSAVGVRKDNPAFGAGAVVSAADGRRSLSRSAVASIYGEQMTTDTARTLVDVNGVRATLLFASATQINFVIPDSVRYRQAHVIVTSPSGRQTTALTALANVSPALFTLDGTGSGEAAALDAIAFTPGPFRPGSIVALFGTGIRNASQVSVKIGGVAVEVTGYAAHTQFAGLDQVNIRIPADFALRGSQAVELIADGEASAAGVRITLL